MSVKGFRAPSPWEKASQKKLLKKCPSCGKDLRRTTPKNNIVMCKNCGKIIRVGMTHMQ